MKGSAISATPRFGFTGLTAMTAPKDWKRWRGAPRDNVFARVQHSNFHWCFAGEANAAMNKGGRSQLIDREDSSEM
jgi:hypothetical protein